MLKVIAQSVLVATRFETDCQGRFHLTKYNGLGRQEELLPIDHEVMKRKNRPFERFIVLTVAACGLLVLVKVFV